MDLDKAKEIVTQLYKKHLLRDPDEGGLEHYSIQLLDGTMSESKVTEILKSSDEYRRKHAHELVEGVIKI